MSKHTPGPWYTGNGKGEQVIYDSYGNAVADAKVYHLHMVRQP